MTIKNKIKKLSDEEVKLDREIVLDFINEKQSVPKSTLSSIKTNLQPVKPVISAVLKLDNDKLVKLIPTSVNAPVSKKPEVKISESSKLPRQRTVKPSVLSTEKNFSKKTPTKNKSAHKPVKKLAMSQFTSPEPIKKISGEKVVITEKLNREESQAIKKLEPQIKRHDFKYLLKLIFSASILVLIIFFAAYAFFWLIFNAISLS